MKTERQKISSAVNNPPNAGAIIINWHSWKHLTRCLAAIIRQETPFFRIVVIDNDDDDKPVEWFDVRSENFHYVKMDQNVGFAKANNIALEYLDDCEWIALINPDAFLEPSWLKHMLDAAAKNPDFSFFACRLVMANDPEFLDGTGDVYHASGLVWRDRHGMAQKTMSFADQEVFSPCAAAAIYRRDDLIAVGGFDEDFFCYIEDVDLGFRLRLNGHRCRFASDAIAYHVGSATTGGGHSDTAVYYGHRNMVWAFMKNVPGFLFWALLPWHLLMNLVGVAVFAWRGQLRVILAAKRDALLDIPNMWKKRRAIQSQRKASIRAIWNVMDKRTVPASAPWNPTRKGRQA
ncbi:glycosyltransferase family 2 protein [Desulfococcus multivorans]|uniref:Glycosyl transferase family 2 n=1 Tax=Desulfococcus multivorans DSM 2059 TaxID=1121405 RepID=S7UYJ9_DESML|nr:glycosyltransferase family 2 protein [Desulfococcus multivorans]AOY57508.1 glycosyl transferase, family 2 [Desulfococcus multivorans]AQU99935.1 glycosyltransferase [Desulfococcus multivorans]EPR39314.1 glycosyl transferase family 2 [Desulfococcus multivorans DSM 2059]SKA12578.1 Glycosyltransferase, GT2 family [Desulfococcus multivorans DSM 2059]